jgi:hypothetical protein
VVMVSFRRASQDVVTESFSSLGQNICSCFSNDDSFFLFSMMALKEKRETS